MVWPSPQIQSSGPNWLCRWTTTSGGSYTRKPASAERFTEAAVTVSTQTKPWEGESVLPIPKRYLTWLHFLRTDQLWHSFRLPPFALQPYSCLFLFLWSLHLSLLGQTLKCRHLLWTPSPSSRTQAPLQFHPLLQLRFHPDLTHFYIFNYDSAQRVNVSVCDAFPTS